MAFFTKVDYNRQLRQKSGDTVTFSGSTNMSQDLNIGSGLTINGGMSAFTSFWHNYLASGTGFPCSTGHTFIVGPHSATSASCNVNITTFSGVSGTTAVLSIGQTPINPLSGGTTNPGISASTLQIKRDGILDDTGRSFNDVAIDTSGNFVKAASSSKRYKTNLVKVESGRYLGLLGLTPYHFKYKNNGMAGFGLMAEDLHTLGYKELVMYDVDGRPDNIHYKLLSVALIQLIKDIRKDVYSGDINTTTLEKDNTTKVITSDYTTNGEYLLVVTEKANVILNSTVDTKIKIKSLSNTTITPDKGLIDNKWETIELSTDSSVEFVFISDLGYWVIVSSDGIKDS